MIEYVACDVKINGRVQKWPGVTCTENYGNQLCEGWIHQTSRDHLDVCFVIIVSNCSSICVPHRSGKFLTGLGERR